MLRKMIYLEDVPSLYTLLVFQAGTQTTNTKIRSVQVSVRADSGPTPGVDYDLQNPVGSFADVVRQVVTI